MGISQSCNQIQATNPPCDISQRRYGLPTYAKIKAGSDIIRQGMRWALDTILPPQDLLIVQGDQTSRKLWQKIHFLDAPCCHICGYPFAFETDLRSLCAACAVRKPNCSQIRAAMAYDEASRALILSFKHGGRTEALDMFAAQMRRAGRELLSDMDYIMPVPLHPRRLIKRRYNQSLLLARALSKTLKAEVKASSDPDIPDIIERRNSGDKLAPTPPILTVNLLRRIKATQSQAGKSAIARRHNMRGAFDIPDQARARIKDAGVILVDDVMTTGATLEACARALRRAGARDVKALCLARVVKPQAL